MNKKIVFLGFFALLLTGLSMFAKLGPRQQRACQPYLIRVAAVGVPMAGAVCIVAITRSLKQRNKLNHQRRAIDQAVAEGETWLLLRPKEARSVDVEKITLWKRLANAQPTTQHFSFEVFGNSDKQGFAIHASQIKVRTVLREFFQEWSDMQRRSAGEEDPAIVPKGWHIHWVEVGPASTEKPITISSRDPLLGVLSEIADVPGPTRALVQVITRTDTTIRKQLGQKSTAMRTAGTRDAGMRYLHTKEANTLEERSSQSFLQAVIRVAAISPHPDWARSTANALVNTLCNQFGPENPVVILARSIAKRPVTLADRSITGGAICSWADDEIATLAHLPGGDALKFAPLLITGSAKSLPANPDLRIPQKARLANYELHTDC